MKQVRFSRNRQAILNCLRATDTHPTAEWVFARLRPTHPSLSLATVYRNLAQLKEAGLVNSMGIVQGKEHFDADVSPHTHVLCVRCERLTDVPDVSVPPDLLASVAGATGFDLSAHGVQFSGLCPDCQSKQKEEQT